MIPEWLALAAQAAGGGGGGGSPIPVVSAVTVASTNSGACSGGDVGTPAQIRVSWVLTNVDTANYHTVVFENGLLIAVLSNDVLVWNKTIDGNVETVERGGFNRWVSAWTYTVKVQRIADSVFTSSADSATWAQPYDTCS